MAHFHWENACYLSWQKSPKGAHLHMHLETTTLFIALTEVNWWQSVETYGFSLRQVKPNKKKWAFTTIY